MADLTALSTDIDTLVAQAKSDAEKVANASTADAALQAQIDALDATVKDAITQPAS